MQSADHHYLRALAAFDLSNWKLASRELKEQLAITPQNAKAMAMLAACSINLGKADDSISQARQAIALNPNSSYAYYVLSFAQLAKRQIFEAEISIEEALKLEPHSALYLVAYSDQKVKDHNAAIKLLQQALAVDPTHAGALLRMHERLLDTGRKAEAEQIRKTMLALYPNDARMQASSGWQSLEAPGQHRQALEHFKEAVRLNPNTTGTVQGYLKATYQNKSALARLVKYLSRTRLLKIAAMSTIGATIYYALCQYVVHITPSVTFIFIAIGAPLLLMILVYLLELLDRGIFWLSIITSKKDRQAALPNFKKQAIGVAIGVFIGGGAIALDVVRRQDPDALKMIPSWLYQDWQTSNTSLAIFMPLVFLFAICAAVASAVYIARKHLMQRPRNTAYFLSIMGLVWSINILSWFAVKAMYGPKETYSYYELAIMLVILIVPQTKACRNYIKNAIKKDQEKK